MPLTNPTTYQFSAGEPKPTTLLDRRGAPLIAPLRWPIPLRLYILERNIVPVPNRALSEQDYLILASISTRPLHGYAITQEVRQLTGGELELSPGTLYKALDRMLGDGWIEVDNEEIVNSRLRRSYRLTGAGHAVLSAEVERRSAVQRAVRRRLREFRLGESL